ncbi:MAG TPA: efflux RND transporter periplasmic adaptor subunit [Woeseiaceae bacterium]
MNRILTYLAAAILLLLAGFLLGRQWQSDTHGDGPAAASGEREILYWVAPMDPNYRRDGPGKSPMGMDLVPVYADEVDAQPGVVRIDPVMAHNLGIRTGIAARGTLPRRIETVGYIIYDEDTVQHVHTRVDGWIERLETKASGDPVKRGQLLFEIYSPTLVNAQQEYLTALKSNNASLKAASRERLLALGVADAEIARLEKDRAVSRRIRVVAENDGVIAHLGVREGIYVTPSLEVMSIAQLDKVWVIAEVFERQVAWVEPGQRATVELDYLPGTILEGVVDYVYPELDPKTRTLKVRLRFDNESLALRPNMFSRVVIEGRAVHDIVHVPREAVIRGGIIDRVVVDIGDGRFRAQPVRIGVESGDRVAIRSGLDGGERVVTSAQFLIDSESNIESALSRIDRDMRMDHSGHDMGDAAPVDHGDHDMSDHDAMDRAADEEPGDAS